ncbi:hypothetical protein Pcinc_040618 [Petrolisthes cinctipes]|uniref:NACHT domain-containing protein n=1 Tax=Petrolisthes cinctipes TaxID=88211 RepID=A0AAE1EHU9_PETCI|nr:hypothetical protein Pcinc_040618 [Petrolisthes cinctipes]
MGTVTPVTSRVGYTAEDINFGRLFKAATQTSKKLLKEVLVMMMYRVTVSVVSVLPTTVAEFCFQFLLWSKTKFRDNFKNEERTTLKQPIECADFDVSLLTKMIHKFFPDMGLPESFSRAVRDLKNVRNRVCHQHEILDEAQLRANLEDLKKIFDDVLQETAEFFSIKLQDMQRHYKHEIDEILNSPLEADSSVYFENVEKFRVDLVGQFLTLGRKEVMKLYIKLRTLHPFTWMSDERFPEMTVDKIFTPLNIMEKCRAVGVTSILTTESIDEETDSPTGILPSVLILSGVAGCGKTSLCKYLIHDWRLGHGAVDTLRSVDILLFIELRNVTSGTLVSYMSNKLLPETCRQFEEKDIIRTLRKISVLYVIDGMDEATPEGKQLVNDVFSILGTSRAIITTRPEYSFTVTQMAARHHLTHMTLTNKGFSSSGIMNYASQVFAALEPDAHKRHQQECEFLKFLRTSGAGLGDHLKLPLTVALLICLWKYDRQTITRVNTATKLYNEIFRLCSTKLVARLQSNSVYHQLELESFASDWILALGREAYEMLEKSEFIMSEACRRKLASMCSSLHIDSIQIFSAFLMCEVKESFFGITYEFSFLHKSQMEYLAALHIANELTKESPIEVSMIDDIQNLKIFSDVFTDSNITFGSSRAGRRSPIRSRKWINTLTFVIGHMCMNNSKHKAIEEVTNKLFESYAFGCEPETLWWLVQESDNHPYICQKAGDSIGKKFVWRPDTIELCDVTSPTFQLMCRTSFIPTDAVIRVVGNLQCVKVLAEDGKVEQRCYDNIKPILERLSSMPTVHVILKCDQHYYDWGNPDTTDQLLLKLLPKGNLSNLLGHVGEKGAAALSAVKNISEILVRVSEPAAIHALAKTFKTICDNVSVLAIRLDMTPSVPPSALTAINAKTFVLVMRHIDDGNVSWAAHIVATLSHSYQQIDLMASSITLSGAKKFIKQLNKDKIKIKESLTVRSTHHLDESEYKELGEKIECSLHWWS